MAHANIIEDAQGELEDIRYYCSDWCAKFDSHLYAGWNGCHELYEPTNCHTCETALYYHRDGDKFEQEITRQLLATIKRGN